MASMQALVSALAHSAVVPADPPSRPVANGNTVYMQENQALYAFDMHNGKLLWQFAYGQYLPNQDLATFLVGQKAIDVVISDGGPASTGPVYGRDGILFQRSASTLLVINPASGSLLGKRSWALT